MTETKNSFCGFVLARTTGRADYDENGNDRYSFCEGSQKYKLHAPVGAWQRSCAEDHGRRA